MVDIVSLCAPSVVAAGLRVLRSPAVQCGLSRCRCRTQYSARDPAARIAWRSQRPGKGVAIIPSVLRTDLHRLKIVRVVHRRKTLRDRHVIQWDKRRPMPSYAQDFCASLAAYMREASFVAVAGQPSRLLRADCQGQQHGFERCTTSSGACVLWVLMRHLMGSAGCGAARLKSQSVEGSAALQNRCHHPLPPSGAAPAWELVSASCLVVSAAAPAGKAGSGPRATNGTSRLRQDISASRRVMASRVRCAGILARAHPAPGCPRCRWCRWRR